MNFAFICLTYLSLLNAALWCQENGDKKAENERNCRERNRLITTDKGDIYKLVDATPGQKLILQCHYCKEDDDQQPKVWYRIEKLTNSSATEVKLGMDSNSSLNRLYLNEQHSLVFRDVTANDSGFYYCLGLDGQKSENKYSYLLDIVFENETSPETGNLTSWRKYHDEYLAPVNKLFASSTAPDYEYIREKLLLQVEAVTEWEPWGSCEICGRPQGDGRRRKKGFCRLKLSSLPNNKTNAKVIPKNSDEAFLLNAYEISCRSMIMGRLFPAISNTTQYLPHFIQAEHCEGRCNPDAEGLGKGWKSGKTLGFKYRKSYVLAQDAHLILVCPESSLENVVSWRRNGKLLDPGESVQPSQPDAEPRITVDTFNTLYLHGVTDEEEGNYTCQVDDIRMQQVTIYVVSKSRLLTQAFVRHVMYLAFVLSLTLTCYCAGLVVTCKRRHTFKGYKELRAEERKTKHDSDDDDDGDNNDEGDSV